MHPDEAVQLTRQDLRRPREPRLSFFSREPLRRRVLRGLAEGWRWYVTGSFAGPLLAARMRTNRVPDQVTVVPAPCWTERAA